MRGEKSPKNETTVSCAFRLRRVILYSMTATFYLLAMVFFYKAYDVKINCAPFGLNSTLLKSETRCFVRRGCR